MKKIALAGVTGLRAFLCSKMTRVGLQFKGTAMMPAITQAFPSPRREWWGKDDESASRVRSGTLHTPQAGVKNL